MNNRPYELAVNKKGGSCRSDWYAHDHEAACGFAHDPQGRRIFDSQVSMHAEPVWRHRQFKVHCSLGLLHHRYNTQEHVLFVGFLLQFSHERYTL